MARRLRRCKSCNDWMMDVRMRRTQRQRHSSPSPLIHARVSCQHSADDTVGLRSTATLREPSVVHIQHNFRLSSLRFVFTSTIRPQPDFLRHSQIHENIHMIVRTHCLVKISYLRSLTDVSSFRVEVLDVFLNYAVKHVYGTLCLLSVCLYKPDVSWLTGRL